MNLQPTLENQIVRIRPLEYKDKEPLYDIAMDMGIWEQHPSDRYLRPEFDKFFNDCIGSKGALVIVDAASNKIIGTIRFVLFKEFPNVIEIGCTFLGRNYWGGKYNGAAKELMKSHAFKFVDNIVLFVDNQNIRSQIAVQRIGGKRLPQNQYLKNYQRQNLTIQYF